MSCARGSRCESAKRSVVDLGASGGTAVLRIETLGCRRPGLMGQFSDVVRRVIAWRLIHRRTGSSTSPFWRVARDRASARACRRMAKVIIERSWGVTRGGFSFGAIAAASRSRARVQTRVVIDARLRLVNEVLIKRVEQLEGYGGFPEVRDAGRWLRWSTGLRSGASGCPPACLRGQQGMGFTGRTARWWSRPAGERG